MVVCSSVDIVGSSLTHFAGLLTPVSYATDWQELYQDMNRLCGRSGKVGGFQPAFSWYLHLFCRNAHVHHVFFQTAGGCSKATCMHPITLVSLFSFFNVSKTPQTFVSSTLLFGTVPEW